MCLLVLARVLTLVGGTTVPELAARWAQFAPFEYSGVSAMTLILAGVFVVLGNQFADEKFAYRRVIERRDDHLDELFYRSIVESDRLVFTLKSGKVYVGQVLNMPTDLANERKFVRLLPLLSGCRDSTTHRLTFTTDYSKVYERMSAAGAPNRGSSADEFALVVPIGEIATASLFDCDVYEWFNEPDSAP